MFADSLLDSALINHSHRGWTTLISFSMQALLVGAALMVPLLYTEGLPSLRLMRQTVIGPPPSQGPPPKIEPSHGRNFALKNPSGLVLMPQKGITPRDRCFSRASAGACNWRRRKRIEWFWRSYWSPKFNGRCKRYPDATATGASSSDLALDGGQPHSSSAAGISAIGNSNPHSRSGRTAGGHQPRRDNRKLAGGQRSSIAGAGRS